MGMPTLNEAEAYDRLDQACEALAKACDTYRFDPTEKSRQDVEAARAALELARKNKG